MSALSDQILGLARLSVEDPRAGVRSLLTLGIPLPARTAGLLLMAVLSTLGIHLGFLLLPAPDDPVAQFMSQSPFRSAVIQWLILAATVLLIHRVGRAFGGKGTLADALLVVVWLQVIMFLAQIAQLLVLIVMPPLVGIANLAGLVLFFWLLTSFVAELHGFASRWRVLAGIIGSSFALAMVLAVVLTAILGPEVLQGV